jgi:hypothetical protein
MSIMELDAETYATIWLDCFDRCIAFGMSPGLARWRTQQIMDNAFVDAADAMQREFQKDTDQQGNFQ